MSRFITIHCQPALEDFLTNSQLSWSYNNDQDVSEIDVIVKDVESLEDDELCTHYGINYNEDVNCVEAYNFTP